MAGPGTWSTFWEDAILNKGPAERCYIPGDGQDAVDRHWAEFANMLPREAQVVDLGCGSGTVGRTLLGCRSDLRVTGGDWADVPTARSDNLAIHAGVSMESLPFDDGRFDAAISLFGIEYGDIEQTARQLGRC